MTPSVRRAIQADEPAIDELIERALAQYRDVDELMHLGYLRYSLGARHAPGAEQLVAEMNRKVAGSVLFDRRVRHHSNWPRTLASFGTLMVDPSQRRRGIGAALVSACIDRAREEGATGLAIDTMPFMTAALEFYGPFGFERWPAGDWDGTPLLQELIGRLDAPRTIVSAWRIEFD